MSGQARPHRAAPIPGCTRLYQPDILRSGVMRYQHHYTCGRGDPSPATLNI
jgi:hypothetical protein